MITLKKGAHVPRITVTPKALTAINRATKVVGDMAGGHTFYVVQPTPDTYAIAVVSENSEAVVTVDVVGEGNQYTPYREPFSIPAAVFYGSGGRTLAIGTETVSVETTATMVTYDLPGEGEHHGQHVDAIASTIAAVMAGAGQADMFTIPAITLEGIATALSTDYARPILTNAHVDGGDIVATDSYRLAYAPVESGDVVGELSGAAIRYALTVKASTYLVRFAAEGERAVIAGGGVAVMYRFHPIGGNFPGWRKLIPDTSTMSELISTPNGVATAKAFTATVKAAGGIKAAQTSPAIFTRDGVSMSVKGDTYAITGAMVPGSWFEPSASGKWAGVDGACRFNATYMAAALGNYTGAAWVHVNDNTRPAIIAGLGSPVVSLLMPVRA